MMQIERPVSGWHSWAQQSFALPRRADRAWHATAFPSRSTKPFRSPTSNRDPFGLFPYVRPDMVFLRCAKPRVGVVVNSPF